MYRPFAGFGVKIVFIVLLILSLSAFALSARSVVIVYDDSNSMKDEDRWYYANYALQALSGLLSDEDNLFVVRMSNPERAIDFSDLGRREITERILNEFRPESGTPYQSIRTAMDTLYELYDEDSWLIVLSDGEFNEEWNPERYGELDMDELQFEISDFIAETGTKTVYFLIGDESLADRETISSWEINAQAQVMTAGSRREITQKMQDIAEQVTSRSKGQVATAEGNTLIVDTPFPLHRLTILDQTGTAGNLFSIAQAKDSQDQILDSTEAVSMKTPSGSPETIQGKIIHLRERRKDQVIPEGEIRVRFDSEVRLDTLTVLPDVALSFQVFLTDKDGNSLSPNEKGIYSIYEDQKIIVNGQLVHGGTGEPVELRKIAEQIEELDVKAYIDKENPVDLELEKPQEALFTHAVTFPEGDHRISASAEFPGYFNFKSNIFTIDAQHYYRSLGIEKPSGWTVGQLSLSEGSALIRPTADGLPVSAEEFKEWPKPGIDSDGRIWFNVEKAERGWEVTPRPFLFYPLFTSTGEITVSFDIESQIDGESGSGRTLLTVERTPFLKVLSSFLFRAPWNGTPGIVWIALVIVYLVGIVKKPRFPKGATVAEIEKDRRGRKLKNPRPRKLQSVFFKRWLVPFVPEKNSKFGVVFKAHKEKGKILIKKSTVRNYTIDTRKLDGPEENGGYYVLSRNDSLYQIKKYDDNKREVLEFSNFR